LQLIYIAIMKNFKQLLFLSILCSLVLFNACSEDEDPVTDTSFIYLDENGVTIKATENAVIGESYELDGVSYLVLGPEYDELDWDNYFEIDWSKLVTTNVTDMDSLFIGEEINQEYWNVSSWDVSNVTTMAHMFDGDFQRTSFNYDLSFWDVSKVTDMSEMFHSATSFNQDISSWDVSNVTDMYQMFGLATSFNQDISSWDVSNVTTMWNMFGNAKSFNQDISLWDVSKVTDMGWMFRSAEAFNQDLSSWDVSKVTDCNQFSYEATAWTEPKPNFTNCTE
jgi:surface protein